MNKKLNIVTSANSGEKEKIFIVGNGAHSNLTYLSSKGEQIDITGEGSEFRPLRCSELFKKLSERDWNITCRKFISTAEGEDEMLKIKFGNTNSDPIAYINSSNSSSGYSASNPSGISEEEKELFRTEYKEILDGMAKNEIYIYNSSKNIIDFVNNSVIINAIKYDSDIYTNTLSLNELLNNSSYPGISGKVDVTIQYSKDNFIVNHDVTFEAFKFSDDKLTNNNFIEDINSEVIFEYTNNIIKVLPKSNDIDECIIRNCTITYGNLNK